MYKNVIIIVEQVSFSFIKKLSLIGNNGIGIAQVPKNADNEPDVQLQSGFLSAILSYSKEVHKAELEALTMHDRTLTFINSHGYVLIVEFSNAVDKKLMNRILNQMKMELDPIFIQYPDASINPSDAEIILNKISGQEWIDSVLNNFGLGRPLDLAQIEKAGSTDFDEKIKRVISRMDQFNEPFMLPLQEDQECLYVVPIDDTYNYLKLPIEKEIELFRMAPLLKREVFFLKDLNISASQRMLRLKQMPDLGYKLEEEDQDLISLSFVKENVKKRLDAAIDAIIRGKSVIVIGEKITTRIVVNTLQIFSQHLHSNVNPWLGEEATEIPQGTTGISKKKYQILKSSSSIPEDVIIVNLANKKVENGEDNKYIQKLVKSLKSKNKLEIKENIRDELNEMVTLALTLTELLSFPLEEAQNRFKAIKDFIKETGKFELIIHISAQRNPALKILISDLSETLKQAESFLGEF